MAEKYPETQGLINLLSGVEKKEARSDLAAYRRDYVPVLGRMEAQIRLELRAMEEAEAMEDHPELMNRWERKRGKYKAALKQIDAIQDGTRRLHKIIQELEPLLQETVDRAIKLAGYDDPAAT